MNRDWKSIRSAPRDGTRVLVYDTNTKDLFVAYYWWPVNVYKLSDRKHKRKIWQSTDYYKLKPSHWFPLPNKPSRK